MACVSSAKDGTSTPVRAHRPAPREAGCQALRKRGYFAVLSAKERGVRDAPALPRYDVSWICDDGATEAS